VIVPKRIGIGYFRQDAGESSERAVIDEAVIGSGRAGELLNLSGGGEKTASKPLVFHGTYEEWVERTGHEAPGVRS